MKRVENLILITAIIFALHIAEEYLTRFYEIDAIFLFFAAPFLKISTPIVIFTLFQIGLWICLIYLYSITKKRTLATYILLIEIIIMFELHHVYEAIISGKYYSGLITAVLLQVMGIVLWKNVKNAK